MAAFAAGRIDASGNGKYLPAIFRREICSDQRAAGEVGLDDDCAQGHSGDDAIADGKGLLVRFAVEWILGDDGAVGGNALEKFVVLRRKHYVDARAENADRATLARQS